MFGMPMLRLSDVAIVRLIVAAIVSGHEALVRHYTVPCIQPISGQAPMSWTWSPWTMGMATGIL